MKSYAIAAIAVLLLPSVLAADWNEHDQPSQLNYDTLASNSCYRREIDALRSAASASLESAQRLSLGAAEAYDRLASLGQTC